MGFPSCRSRRSGRRAPSRQLFPACRRLLHGDGVDTGRRDEGASTAAGMVVGARPPAVPFPLAQAWAGDRTGLGELLRAAGTRTAKRRTTVSRCAATGRLGPDGFLEARLGMSQREALRDRPDQSGAHGRPVRGVLPRQVRRRLGRLGPHGYFTRGRGLSIIHGQDRMHTPQGIRRGSRARAVTHSFARIWWGTTKP